MFPEFVLFLVFAIGTMASLFGFFWARRLKSACLGAPGAVRADSALADFVQQGPSIAGELDVQAPSAKALVDRLAYQLEHPLHTLANPWAAGTVKRPAISIERLSDSDLSFTAEGMSVSGGLVRASDGPNGRVRLRWAVGVPSARTLLTLAQFWSLCIALPVSILGPILIFIYVLGSNNPAVKAQFLQVAQVAQLIWEPFLFAGIAAQRIKSGRFLEAAILGAAYEIQNNGK